MFHARVLAGVFILCAVGTLLRRFRRGWEVLAILFATGYLVMLSHSVIPFHRYFLPVGVMIYLFAGLGAAALLNLFRPQSRGRIIAGALMLLLIAGVQGWRCADYLDQFADDGRERLRRWVNESVTPGSIILAESYTGLGGGGDIGVRKVWAGPEAGDLERLERWGIKYVVIADTQYARYNAPVHRTDDDAAELARYRAWYQKLDADYAKVWSNEPNHPTNSFTNPTLKVYRLGPKS